APAGALWANIQSFPPNFWAVRAKLGGAREEDDAATTRAATTTTIDSLLRVLGIACVTPSKRGGHRRLAALTVIPCLRSPTALHQGERRSCGKDVAGPDPAAREARAKNTAPRRAANPRTSPPRSDGTALRPARACVLEIGTPIQRRPHCARIH